MSAIRASGTGHGAAEKRESPPRARQLAMVTEAPPAGVDRYDYADAFELRVREPDERSAEQWARCAFEQAPRAARWTVLIAWRTLLRVRMGPRSSPNHIFGCKILASQPDVIHLNVSSRLLRGVIVARRVEPTRMMVTTFVVYRRPAPARVVWTIAAPIHRRLARSLMEHACTEPPPGLRTA
jgi:hypothetical protein